MSMAMSVHYDPQRFQHTQSAASAAAAAAIAAMHHPSNESHVDDSHMGGIRNDENRSHSSTQQHTRTYKHNVDNHMNGAYTTSTSAAVTSHESPTPAATSIQYLSFFKYVTLPLSTISHIRDELYVLFQRHQCRGRIYISPEGINAQMILPVTLIPTFHTAIQQYTVTVNNSESTTSNNNNNNDHHDSSTAYQPFNHIKLTLGQTTDIMNYSTDHVLNPRNSDDIPIFDKLHIRIKHRLVQDGLPDDIHDQLQLHDFGELLSPEEWHHEVMKLNENRDNHSSSSCSDSKVKLLDVRNYYESDVGRFENAIPLDITTFREVFHAVDKAIGIDNTKDTSHDTSSLQHQPTAVLAYCTGGIRCIKVGAYLKSKGIKNVKLLDGGINNYYLWAKEQMEKQQHVNNTSSNDSDTQ
jgi:UPF0176 protein